MSQPTILLTRIDNRLVHGQVGMTWVNTIGANLVVVANDAASENVIEQNLMEMVLPDTVQIRFFTIEKTIRIIGKAAPHQKILLVVKTPADALKLVEGGVPIPKINIGNLHFETGKQQLTSVISVDEADIAIFKTMNQQGVALEVQGIPNERAVDLMKLLEQANG